MQKSNSVSEFYNKFPYPNYKIKSLLDLENLKFQKFLLEIVKSNSSGNEVLEIGSGTGELALLLAKDKYKVTGYDISEESLKIAKANADKFGLEVKFVNKDILKSANRNVFDICIANGVLHHTTKPLLGLTNIAQLTRRNGLVVTVVYNKYGSVPRLIFSKVFRSLPGNTISKILLVRRFTFGRYSDKSDAVVADTFFHPFESQHSLNEVLKWHNRVGLKVVRVFPPIDIRSYSKLIINIVNTGDIYGSINKVYGDNNPVPVSIKTSRLRLFIYQILWTITTKGNVFVVVSRRN